MREMGARGIGISSAKAGVGSQSHLTKERPALFIYVCLVLALLLSPASPKCLGAESNAPPPVASSLAETNFQALLQGYSQLQEQLHATQVGIEQSRQEVKEALTRGLQTIQRSISAEKARELGAMQRSNKVMLLVVGTFAVMGFLTMLMMTYFQWRTSNSLAVISTALPTALGLGPDSIVSALGPADSPLVESGQVEQSNLRLRGAVEQLEKRTHELAKKSHLGAERRKGTHIENRLFAAPDDSFRIRQSQALKLAVILGLFCGAVLTLLISRW